MRRSPLLAVGLTLSLSLAGFSAVSPASAAPPAVVQSVTSSPQKQLVITKIRATLTTFYSDAELSRLLDQMMQNAYDNKPIADVFPTEMPYLPYQGISVSKLTTLFTVMSNVQKDLGSGWTIPFTKGRSTFLTYAQPTFDRVAAAVQKAKKAGKTKTASFNAGLDVLATMFTMAHVNGALTAYKKSLTAKEWQAIRTHGAALILWGPHRP